MAVSGMMSSDEWYEGAEVGPEVPFEGVPVRGLLTMLPAPPRPELYSGSDEAP